MTNRQLKEKIDNVWNSLKGLKADQMEYQIGVSRQLADIVVGVAEIQKIRNSSLLKYLIYELIDFIEEKCASKTSSFEGKSVDEGRSEEVTDSPLESVRQLKQMMGEVKRRDKNSSGEIRVDKHYFNAIVRKISSLEQQLKQETIKKRFEVDRSQDPQGTQAMIEQLEYLLKKKEGRIKELNNELEQNFNDKEELEQQIEALEERNIELQDTVKLLEEESNRSKDQLQKYKAQQKEQILFGASQFMNSQFPHKQTESTVHEEEQYRIPADMLTSTQLLSRYCKQSEEKDATMSETPSKLNPTQEKTVKKNTFKMTEQQPITEEEQNLMESMRIYKKKPEQLTISNEDHMLERILLMQASFIQRAMESLID